MNRKEEVEKKITDKFNMVTGSIDGIDSIDMLDETSGNHIDEKLKSSSIKKSSSSDIPNVPFEAVIREQSKLRKCTII